MCDLTSYRYRRIHWGCGDNAANAAISEFKLYDLGWMKFEALDWVRELDERYSIITLSREVSSILGFEEPVRKLFQSADKPDRPGVLNFFAGKLGLELLSCRRSGSASGLCDKMGAFIEIVRIYGELLESEEQQ